MPNDSIAKLATTTTTETTAWIPRDVYAGLIIEEAQKSRLLAGQAGAIEHVQAKGTGKTVTARFFPKRTAQGPISEGNALSLVASTPTNATLTFDKYGDAAELTRESIDQTTDDVRARFLAAMGRGLARKFDEVAYTMLATSGNRDAGNVKSLATGGDLETNEDFAAKLWDLIDVMRKTEYTPDTIYVGVDQNSALAKMKMQNAKIGAAIKLDANGQVIAFRGLKVVELPFANANAGTADLVQAVVIDSSVAFGEVFGLSPLFEELRIQLRDVFQYTVWAEYGCGPLIKKGVGHVKNPAAP